MRRGSVLSGLIVSWMFIASFCALQPATAGAGISEGDYWKYSLEMSEEAMSFDGWFEVTVEDERTVGGVEIFLIDISGSGDLTGMFLDATISGDFELRGTEERLASNFSMVSDDIVIDMSFDAMGVSVSGKMGYVTTYEPSIDDYIGDDDPAPGLSVTSRADTTVTSWSNFLGLNGSDTSTEEREMTMTVTDVDVIVTVPAGTFTCYEVEIETVTDGHTSTVLWYYSDEVGYYVKMSLGPDDDESLLELEEYGRGEGVLSFFTGENLWLTGLLVVILVLVVAVVLVSRSRRRRTPTDVPPPPDAQGPPAERRIPETPPGEPPEPPPQRPPTG